MAGGVFLDGKVLIKRLEKAALDIRISLLELCATQVIHIGGDLSIADMMTALWQYKMLYKPEDPSWEGRDRFVLSKGHASAVTSFNQAAIGCFPKEDIIKEYATDGGRFSMHSCNLVNPFVDVSTGSLGHGFPIALGVASGLRLKGNNSSRVYVVMGDAEQSEGSIWEAAMNAVYHELGNIVAIIDSNGLGGDNALKESTALADIGEKYRVIGWNVSDIDGNDMGQVVKALDNIPPADSRQPSLIICNTVKGKGVSFMENQVAWHCGRITDQERDDSIKTLRDEFELRWRNREWLQISF